MIDRKLRAIAFVLPQFHPIPENDAWWGKGFTEWTNVTKAKPLFEGHYQPHLPTDLGFYDLRLPEARQAQAKMAKDYGIHGFCYYHYWFNGNRLLHQPIDGMLNQKELDMPFMFCWANENWTRRWDGKEDDVLMKQVYSFEDDKAHMRWLCEYVFSDDRYIRVNDCPVFMVYRFDLFPDINQTVKLWREIAVNEYGYKGLYLCITESFGIQQNPEEIGFNANVEFPPHYILNNKKVLERKRTLKEFLGFNKVKGLQIRDLEKGVVQYMARNKANYKLYKCVVPSWDNTARKGNLGVIGYGSSPKLYYEWLKATLEDFKPYSEDENFIFINAMNEWAEGNHLEPCIKYGRAYLEATYNALKDYV